MVKNKTQGYTRWTFKQMMSCLLVFVLMLGLIPVDVLPAFAASAPPTTSLVNADYGVGGSAYARYSSVNFPDPVYFHYFTMDVNGIEQVGFCMNHEKHMGKFYEGQIWNNPQQCSLPTNIQRFMDFYYWEFQQHLDAHSKTNTPCTGAYDNDIIDGKYGSEWTGIWGQWELETANAIFQAALWLGIAGKISDPINDEADKQILANERYAILTNLGYSSTLDDCKAMIDKIANYLNGNVDGVVVPTFNYYVYDWQSGQPTDSTGKQKGIQSIFVPVTNERAPDATGVYVAVKKIAEDTQQPLANCTFGVYDDSACKHLIGSFTTQNSEWSVSSELKVPASKGDKFTLYVKEISASGDYKADSTTVSVQVDRAINNSASNPAKVLNTFINKKRVALGSSDSPVQKVDADTGEGIGPATFHFEGQTAMSQSIYSVFEGPAIFDDPAPIAVSLNQGSFELPVNGSTGYALIDVSGSGLRAGDAFVILGESGSDLKIKKADGTVSSIPQKYAMINLPDVIPSITYNATNATGCIATTLGNKLDIYGASLYDGKTYNERLGRSEFNMPVLYGMAKKIMSAQKAALADNKCLILYEGYRPKSAQTAMGTSLQSYIDKYLGGDETLVTEGWTIDYFINRAPVGNHQMGVAVDISLGSFSSTEPLAVGDKTINKPISVVEGSMPTKMHELSARAKTFTKEYSHIKRDWRTECTLADTFLASQDAVDLQKYMTDAGLDPLASEWWHFNDNDLRPNVKDSAKGGFKISGNLSVVPNETDPESIIPSSSGGDVTAGRTEESDGSPAGGSSSGSTSGSTSGSFSSNTAGTGYYSGDWTTDSNGELSLQWWDPEGENYIPPGEYTVTEIIPPMGYELSTESHHLVLKYDDENGASSSGPIVFRNNRLHIIRIRKIDESGSGLAGAAFDIYRNGQLVTTVVTDESGTFIYAGRDDAGVESGYYTIIETQAPDGYLIPYISSYSVYVDADDTRDYEHILVFKDYRWPEIVIQKLSAGTNNRLAGAVFQVQIDGREFGTFTTGEDGTIIINYEEYGAFWDTHNQTHTVSVREITAPDGYMIDDGNWKTAEFVEGQVLQTFTFTDTEYPKIKIVKRDAETGETLPNTSFRVSIDGALVDTFVTDDQGEIVIDYETYGHFLDERNRGSWTITVTEDEMPQYYNKDKQESTGDYTITQQLTFGSKYIQFEFKDTHYRDIKVIKRDVSNSWLLADATFTLDSIQLDDPQKGEIHREGKTNGSGVLLFEDVPNGIYRLTETIPSTGYSLADPASQIITVTSDSDPVITVEVLNAPRQGLLLRKEDAITKEPIPGVEYSIQFLGTADLSSGTTNDPRTYTTDENGLIYLPDCAPGWYKVQEVSAPSGYVLDDTPRMVQIVNSHEPVVLSLQNYQDGQLIILKKDTQTGLPLANALFEVRTAGGSVIGIYETGPNGFVAVNGLEPGSYVVREIEAPDGHLIDPTPQTFELRRGQTEPVYLIFYNNGKTNLFIRKEDALTHVGLEGAVYTIARSDGHIVEARAVTGVDGFFELIDLEPGTYVVTEKEAPAGYLLDPQPQTIYVEAGKTYSLLFRNNRPGGITLLKIDGVSGLPLANATFSLYAVDDRLLGSYTTGPDGQIRISGLDAGYYFLQETKAPDGYFCDDTMHKIEVKEYQTTFKTLTNYERSSLILRKVDSESGTPLSGATLGVYRMDGTLIQSAETNANGICVIKGLDPGWYRVRELEAPTGYILSNEEQFIEIIEGQPATLTFKNTAHSGILIRKVDVKSKKPLQGAVFNLSTIEGKLIGTYTTDTSGSAVTAPVGPGTYLLTEVMAPAGYAANELPRKVVVQAGEQATVVVENSKMNAIQLQKVDKSTGTYLADAEFELWNSDMSQLLGTYVTDKSGIVFTDPLPANDYIVIESKAPSGYALDKTHHHVQLTYEQPAILKVKDQRLNSIIITKVSTVDDEPLMGAKFLVTTAEGEPVGEYTTDTTGTATTPPLEPGIYYVKEVEAPDLYLINEKVFRVEVNADGTAPLVVEDNPAPSLVIFKGDSRTGRGVAGAVYKVETADGDFIGQYTTDAQGEALVRPINPGHYIVTEMSAPEGYLICETPKTITVKVGIVNRVEFMDAEFGSLVLRLEDKADGHKLENGRFELCFAATGEKVGEGVTDNSGSIVWGSLIPGRYTLVQTFAPDGYTIADKEKSEFVESGKTKTVVFQDYTAGLVVEKLDRLTSKPLSGARFQVTRNSDNIVIGEFETDTDGLALVSGLTPGMYTVEELAAPSGYAIDEASKLVHVKESESAHVTFLDTPYAGITGHAIDRDTNAPLSGIVIEVWKQNGELVDSYTTDNSGLFMTDKLPAGYYILKITHTSHGYTPVTPEQTVEIKDGQSVSVKMEFYACGSLQILAAAEADVGLSGMKVSLTKINGEYIGSYTTDVSGLIVIDGLEPGWYVVTETSGPEGYSITSNTVQNIEVTSNGDARVVFQYRKTYGIQIQTSVKQTGKMVAGVKYKISRLDGSIIGTYTSDNQGLVFAPLDPGWYVVSQLSLPDGFQGYDLSSRNIEVDAGDITRVDFELTQLSSLRIKFIDGTTSSGIYGVRVLLKDGSGKIVDEYTTNHEGYITINGSLINKNYTLAVLSAPNGYYIDSIPRSIDILNGETTEVVWKLYAKAGQVQIHLTSSAYSPVLNLAAGSALQGAVFEVYDPFTYAVLATIETDSFGVAASGGLPLGRYIVREKSPAPYFGLSGKETEFYIKIDHDVVRIEYQAAPLNLGVKHEVKANSNVSAGTSMKYIFDHVDNVSSERLDNFFWTIKVPTDSMRAGTLYTGKWSASVFYSISYKTNMSDYRPLATGLNSNTAYQYDLSSLAINVQGGEYVTDIRFEFGTVSAGFKPTVSPVFYGYVIPNVSNGYKVILRSECGGKYGDQWVTASALWTTNVVGSSSTSKAYNFPATLPKTGY